MPDLWLTCDHFVGEASAMGQPIRPTHSSICPGSVDVITWITVVDPIKRQTRAAYGCFVAGQSLNATAYIGCTPALSVIQKAPLQLQYAACDAI